MTELERDSMAERRKVHISMSMDEPDLMPMLTDAIQKGLCSQFDLAIAEHVTVGRLLSHAEQSSVDLFILMLNNLIFADTRLFDNTPRWRSFEVVSRLKAIYGKPIIAFAASWPDEMSSAEVEEETIKAGANFFFLLPPDKQSFIDAVEQCLTVSQSSR